MSLITRQALIVESPDPSEGGSAFNSSSSTGGSGTAAAAGTGGSSSSQERSCRWSNFGSPVPGTIIEIRLKYDYSWETEANGDVSSDGSCSASAEAETTHISGFSSIGISGPGPISDDDSDDDISSVNVVLPNNTNLSTAAVQARVFATAESGLVGSTGSSSSSATLTISNLRIEITTLDINQGPLCMM